MGDVREALDEAVAAAKHLGPLDAGAVAAARALADKIDTWDVIVDWALDDLAGSDSGGRPAVPANDNTSLPTFLRYCDSLGLTPAGRTKLEPAKEEGAGGKLTILRNGAARADRASQASRA